MGAPLKVLQVDDNPDERVLTLRELRREFGAVEAIEVRDQEELDRALDLGGFDLAITDYSLGWTDGLQVLRAIKRRLPDCPIVMLTGTGTEEVAVEAMKLGLDDYVLKEPRRMIRIGAAARAAIERARLRVERRRADEALRESEERFRQMAERIDQVFYIWSFTPPHVLYVSPAYEKIWGRTVESLSRDPGSWLEAIDPRDRPMLETASREGLGAGVDRIVYRVHRPDGSFRWVETRGFEIADAAGRPYRFVGSASDITERKLAEESTEKLASFTASGIHPVLEFDAEGVITYHNAAAQVILDAFASTEPNETLRQEVRAIVGDCLSRREKNIGLETILEGRTFSWAFIPVPERQVVHAYVTDISHHLELEARLRQSEKMEAIGRLAGGIAHDFGNLLTVIFGYAGFLLEDLPPGSPLRADAEEIRRAADRAAELGRQLLAFGRRQVVEPVVIEPCDVIERTLAMVRRLLPDDIEAVFEPEKGAGCVRMDPGSLEQAIMNLLLNARDAMPRGGRLLLRTGAVDLARGYEPRHIGLPPGPYVTISVTDTGSGIDRETMAHLFEPFYTTKARGRGAGLGLATVHGIVKQAGGDIWVDTEVGKGSTFTLWLPRVAGRQPAEPPRPAPAASGGSETILLVEDETRIRAVAARALRSKGYEVIEAGHGEDAIDAARRHAGPIHLLVSDVVMPVMGGTDLAKWFGLERPGTRILYISAQPGSAQGGPPSSDGASELLVKPFTTAALLGKVREILDR